MPVAGEYEPSPRPRSRDHVEEFESSGGKVATTPLDLPIIVMTTVGAKSGKVRKVPLMRVEHDGQYAAVASMGGQPTHPVWYHNLVADPSVELQDGPVKKDYLAHEATGEERTQWWDIAVAAYPPYAEYQTRTDRQIPVFVLVPKA
jgi:F420H(2)-dependent quinone reductase